MAQDLFEFELSRFDEAFRAARRGHDPRGADLDDGIYPAVITRAEIRRAPGTFTPVLTWHLLVETSDGEGVPVRRTLCITKNSLAWLKEDLAKSGLVLEKLSELPNRLGEMAGRSVMLQKTSRDGQPQLYFRRMESKTAGAG